MKKVILDKTLFAEVLRANSEYDSFCTVINGSLVRLHDSSDLYAFVRVDEGIACKMYIANNRIVADKRRESDGEHEWIEVVGDAHNAEVCFCRETASGAIERVPIACGVQTSKISKSLGRTMARLSRADNRIEVICHKKTYGEDEKAAFQKRSVVDLAAIDSSGVDIIYFDGADKLIEKLLYGGCRELTVFIAEESKAKGIIKRLNKLSRRAPFSNRIVVVVGGTYTPKTTTKLLVGDAADVRGNVPAQVFLSVSYSEGVGVDVSVGQNTACLAPAPTSHRLKPYTIHYVTSIMSELILRAVSYDEYQARRLFKVCAKTLVTETIVKEE